MWKVVKVDRPTAEEADDPNNHYYHHNNNNNNNHNFNNGFGGLESHSLHRDPAEVFVLPPSPPTTPTIPPPTRPPPYRPETPNPLLPYHPDQEYIAPALFNPPSILGNGGLGVVQAPDFTDYADGESVDCEMSEWGPWSPCTHSCGPESLQQRSRNVVMGARGGGAPCGDRYQRRYCHLPPCNRPRQQGVFLAPRPYH